MSAEKVCLRAITTNRDGKSVWTGDYACSICGLRFRPNPTDLGKFLRDFEAHKVQHTTATGK